MNELVGNGEERVGMLRACVMCEGEREEKEEKRKRENEKEREDEGRTTCPPDE